ncbi:thiol-disulfide oxidoreductase DCC family protein [Geobacillus sp. JS12]|uniref:thiol-disulfide oxidoreductase DCC family protein n=1 Tax=Geobacillus sp. JS12 TaxID=1813182 RepID=UPI00078B473F|nr:DCC1-like thiol-disulfide oxidoreductase family protein [Geobacillus sp. JS12]AMQ20390.1 thiol-disulfide oxidoreductase [Geobacillus sp. JS12]
MHPVILFDGDCLFCHASVHWIAARDRKAVFRFAAQQSDVGRAILAAQGAAGGDSVVLVVNGRCYVKSDAVLRIGRRLAWPWNGLAAVGFLVPKPLRDYMYDAIANRRHRLIPKQDRCPLPPPELRARFLDELPQ